MNNMDLINLVDPNDEDINEVPQIWEDKENTEWDFI